MKWILTAVIFLLAGCNTQSGGTSTGNPVTINIQSFNTSLMSKVDALAVSDLRFCFKRLRFKTQSETTNGDSSTDSDNIDMQLGEVRISELGTSLGSFSVPAGTYARVEFDLEDSCSGSSLRVVNGNGTFQTTSRIQIRFEGSLIVSGTQTVNLNIQSIVSALNTVTSNGNIKSKAESASGTL